MNHTIDVERLVQWALVQELPKRELQAAPWDSVLEYGLRGGHRVQVTDALTPQRYAWIGEPHRDALAVEVAINQLSTGESVDWEASKHHLLGDLVACEDGNPLVGIGFSRRALVVKHGRLRNRPDWMPEAPTLERILHSGGGHHVVQHLDDEGRLVIGRGRARHLGPGARCPLQLMPPASEYAHARAEWSVWYRGLMDLLELLEGELIEHVATKPVIAEAPWLTGEPVKPRIFYDARAPLSRGALGPVMTDRRYAGYR